MPRGDGTGPAGQGPMTGRGMGYCAGYDRPGFANPGFGGRAYGRGFGRGNGRGYGFRNRYAQAPLPEYAPAPRVTREDEKELIKDDIEALKSELKAAEDRLNTLS